MRDEDHDLVRAYHHYLETGCAEVLDLSRPMMEGAAKLRAKYTWLKTPDAIHLAAAIEAGCDAFLTNDRRLDRCTEIKIEGFSASSQDTQAS